MMIVFGFTFALLGGLGKHQIGYENAHLEF